MGRPRLLEFEAGPVAEWLFLDLNAYFASVEQETRPELRGRPVGVAALDTPTTVCIAVSYEAKRLGIKTGTMLREARRICPEIAIVEARPKIYVEYHHAILKAVEECVPVTTVMSIDEAACRLMGLERYLPNALAIAASVKDALRGVGATLRCSIGLAPNRYLAKVASDMQKPDGLTVLAAEDLPGALFGLKPGDLPGIGAKMQAKLAGRGIGTMEQLCGLSAAGMRELWGGVVGERLWHWMRGTDFDDAEGARKSLGKQHVLAPELRTREGAWGVAQQLLHKAGSELRRLGLWAGGMGLAVNFAGEARKSGPWVTAPSWKAERRIDGCQDSFTLQEHLRQLWSSCPERAPMLVYVWLFDLRTEAQRTPSLFAADTSKRERASAAMDALNLKFGGKTVYPGGAGGAAAPRIPFKHIPRLDQF